MLEADIILHYVYFTGNELRISRKKLIKKLFFSYQKRQFDLSNFITTSLIIECSEPSKLRTSSSDDKCGGQLTRTARVLQKQLHLEAVSEGAGD